MSLFFLSAAGLSLLAVLLLTREAWWRRGAASAAPAKAEASAEASPSRSLALALVFFVLIVVGIGYAKLGAPDKLALGPETAAAAASAAAAAAAANAGEPKVTLEQVNEMVARLAEHLKAQPDDFPGWMMLGRSYVALGRHAEGVTAYREAAKRQPDEPAALLELANALAMVNDRNLKGEPTELIEKALKLDPTHPKALALAGTAAYMNGDYKTAIARWETLLKAEPPDSELAQRIRETMAKARELGHLDGAPSTTTAAATSQSASAKATAAGSAPAATGAAKVSGTVTLSAALKAQASPDDTVFIFARPATGARMPLAILRKQVKDLPLQFTLDDTLAMSPAAKISDHARVSVGARISKSGNAMPQTGDLQGAVTADVGASGLAVEINEVVGQK